MLFLLSSVVVGQVLNLPAITVDTSSCLEKVQIQDALYDKNCFGTSQKASDVMAQFCTNECIGQFDKLVDSIKKECQLKPQDLEQLQNDIDAFNGSQDGVCKK